MIKNKWGKQRQQDWSYHICHCEGCNSISLGNRNEWEEREAECIGAKRFDRATATMTFTRKYWWYQEERG